MTIASEKRMLTTPTSKIAKADSLPTLLSHPEAWLTLSFETRQRLYSLLPAPKDGEPPWDPDVHPMETELKIHIAKGLGVWQKNLRDGREVRKWRVEAVQAGRDRVSGKWDRVMGKESKQVEGTKEEKDGEGNGR